MDISRESNSDTSEQTSLLQTEAFAASPPPTKKRLALIALPFIVGIACLCFFASGRGSNYLLSSSTLDRGVANLEAVNGASEASCQCEAQDAAWTPAVRPSGSKPKCIFISLGANFGDAYQYFRTHSKTGKANGLTSVDAISSINYPLSKPIEKEKSLFYVGPNHENGTECEAFLIEANPFRKDALDKIANTPVPGQVQTFCPNTIDVCEATSTFYADSRLETIMSSTSAAAEDSNLKLMEIKSVNLMKLLTEKAVADDFVVIAMDVGGAEYDILPCLARSPAANLIDEMYIQVHNKAKNFEFDLALNMLRGKGVTFPDYRWGVASYLAAPSTYPAPCQCEAQNAAWTAAVRPAGSKPKCIHIVLGANNGDTYKYYRTHSRKGKATDLPNASMINSTNYYSSKAPYSKKTFMYDIGPDHESGSECEAFLIEANPFFVDTLDKIANTHVPGQVQTFCPNTVYMCEGTSTFYADNTLSGITSSMSISADSANSKPIYDKSVNLMKLLIENVVADDFVSLDMDIEGAEYDILPCLARSPAAHLVDQVYLEVHPIGWALTGTSPKEWISALSTLQDKGVVFPDYHWGRKF